MRVLIGCERSGVVRRAFRALGHDAWSCDLEPADDGSLYHIEDDLLVALDDGWDLLIAHPPCTYLAGSGLHWNEDDPARALKTAHALEFVRRLLAAPVPRIVIENPRGCIGTRIRPSDQTIQPYEFGEDASKETQLWLVNVPPLVVDPAARRPGRVVNGLERWGNQTDSGQNRLSPSPTRAQQRAETYPAIAKAMAEQWGVLK